MALGIGMLTFWAGGGKLRPSRPDTVLEIAIDKGGDPIRSSFTKG
jgi:hypothetical protein